jgi:uncharacterized protein YjbI with pentapeptide repeats
MKTKRNRVAWGLSAILAAALLAGIGLLGLWLRAFWIAKYRGAGADLHADLRGTGLRGVDLSFTWLRYQTIDDTTRLDPKWRRVWELGSGRPGSRHLHGADLRNAFLFWVSLRGADLSGADLRSAMLNWADLRQADLRGADLRGSCLRKAHLEAAHLEGADLRGADLFGWKGREPASLTGAHYDARTRWPGSYDPQRHGATRVR